MPVICAGPLTCPQINKLSSMSFTVKLAYGLPFAVGIDMSTIQCRSEVMEAGTVEEDPEAGSMI